MQSKQESVVRAGPKRTYAVVWEHAGNVASGGLEVRPDGLTFLGRAANFTIAFIDVCEASIARSRHDRLRGLPVLALGLRGGASSRIACLEGVGVLHELAASVEASAGLRVAI